MPLALEGALRRLSDGDTSVVNARILEREYWETLAWGAAEIAQSAKSAELAVPEVELDAMRYDISTRGYGMIQPGGSWSWEELEPGLERLRLAANALRAAGWPPAFVFCLDLAWDILDRVPLTGHRTLGSPCFAHVPCSHLRSSSSGRRSSRCWVAGARWTLRCFAGLQRSQRRSTRGPQPAVLTVLAVRRHRSDPTSACHTATSPACNRCASATAPR